MTKFTFIKGSQIFPGIIYNINNCVNNNFFFVNSNNLLVCVSIIAKYITLNGKNIFDSSCSNDKIDWE